MKIFIFLTVITCATLSTALFRTKNKERSVIQPVVSYRTTSYLRAETPQPVPIIPTVYVGPSATFRTTWPTYYVQQPSILRIPPPPPPTPPKEHFTSHETLLSTYGTPLVSAYRSVPTYGLYQVWKPERKGISRVFDEHGVDERYSDYEYSYDHD